MHDRRAREALDLAIDAWLEDQRRAAADGTFSAACDYYAYVARR